jgi:hypothetical protein
MPDTLRLRPRGCATWCRRRSVVDRAARPDYKPALPGRDPRSAQVAQLVEHATENRSVGGSIPPLGTIRRPHWPIRVVRNRFQPRCADVPRARTAANAVQGFLAQTTRRRSAECTAYQVGGISPRCALPNATTQSRCSSVSGTIKPRDALINANASSAPIPEQISAQAATTEDRPIPARQWIAMERPSRKSVANERAICEASRWDSGNPRSRIGKEIKSIPLERQSSASRCNPSSETSSCSRRLTTVSTPEFFHSLTSVSSHSSARGRAMIAIRPAVRVSIQCNRDIPNPGWRNPLHGSFA